MSFRLTANESIADGLRRLARQELRSISKHLDGAARSRPDAIHEIRKSVKKARTILQIVDTDKGRGLSSSARRLHAIHSQLSALRDADVMLETLATLRARDRYQSELRTKALASTKRIYARAPREYVNSIRDEWKGWQTAI